MSHFLLIHGAFHGAWCWHKTISELEKRGHRAAAIDLPGQGEDRTPLKQVTLEGMVDRIVETLARFPEPVVLVGHSLSGMAIRKINPRQRIHVRKIGLVADDDQVPRLQVSSRPVEE
jgi:pimeloyl-ACP methyl ester carboxylesterase